MEQNRCSPWPRSSTVLQDPGVGRDSCNVPIRKTHTERSPGRSENAASLLFRLFESTCYGGRVGEISSRPPTERRALTGEIGTDNDPGAPPFSLFY